jgi:hypothetical protein
MTNSLTLSLHHSLTHSLARPSSAGGLLPVAAGPAGGSSRAALAALALPLAARRPRAAALRQEPPVVSAANSHTHSLTHSPHELLCRREVRFELAAGALLVPLDLLSAACFLLQHCVPLRTHLVYKELTRHWRSEEATRDPMEYYTSERSTTALFVIGQTLQALLGSVCWVIGGGCTLLTPSLWHCTFRGIRFTYTRAEGERKWTLEQWDTADCKVWIILLSRVVYMPIDWWCFVLGLFALMSPFRHVPFRREMYQHGCSLCIAGLAGGGDESAAERDFRRGQPAPTGVYNELFVNISLRWTCVYYGFTAVVDVLLFPVMLPLLLTWYRYSPVRADLFNSTDEAQPNSNDITDQERDVHVNIPAHQRSVPIKQWGFREYGIIARQFSLLVFDIFFSPLLCLVYVTQYRFLPVQKALADDDFRSWRSCAVYGQLLRACGLILLDVLISPCLVILFLSYYRWGVPLNIWRVKQFWHGEGERTALCFHFSVVVNLGVVLHDVAVMPIVLLILAVTGMRAFRAFRIVKSASKTCPNCFSPSPPDVDSPSTVNQDAEGHNDIIHECSNPTVAAPGDVEVRITVIETAAVEQQVTTPPAVVVSLPDILPSSTWRRNLWFEFFNLLFDLPFVVLSVIVFFTVWRAQRLYHGLKKIEEDFPENDFYIIENDECCSCDDDDDSCCCCCCNECCCGCCCWFDFYKSYNRRNWWLRAQVLEQFALLIRDVVLLPFMTVVVFTLYRMPGFVLDLISKCSPMNTSDQPVFRATAVRFDCPEAGNVCVSIQCEPNQVAEFFTDEESLNETLADVYSAPVKLFVSGDSFWSSVGSAFGDSIMRLGKQIPAAVSFKKYLLNFDVPLLYLHLLGRGMLPVKLAEGDGIGVGVATRLGKMNMAETGDGLSPSSNLNLDHEGNEIPQLDPIPRTYEIKIKLDVGNAKRTTILKKLRSLRQVSENFDITVHRMMFILSTILSDTLIFYRMYDSSCKWRPNLNIHLLPLLLYHWRLLYLISCEFSVKKLIVSLLMHAMVWVHGGPAYWLVTSLQQESWMNFGSWCCCTLPRCY